MGSSAGEWFTYLITATENTAEEIAMLDTRTRLEQLGEAINALEFDTVFRIEDGAVVTMRYLYAPTVMHDPAGDVEIDGEGWSCLEGMTGQYGYHGAVMHPSEYIGAHIAKELAEMDEGTVFAIVTVDAYPEEEDGETENVGWAIAYRDLS